MFTHIAREHVCRRVNVSGRIPIHEVVERRGENYGNSRLPRVSWIKDSRAIEGSFFGVNESQEGVANTRAEKAARRWELEKIFFKVVSKWSIFENSRTLDDVCTVDRSSYAKCIFGRIKLPPRFTPKRANLSSYRLVVVGCIRVTTRLNSTRNCAALDSIDRQAVFICSISSLLPAQTETR